MLKRVVGYGLVMVLVAAVALTIAGVVVKKKNTGRIAPGVTVCGRDLSGLTMAEAEAVVRELVPDCVTELRCRFLPEMREEIEDCVQEFRSESEYKGTEDVHMTVSEKEVCLTVRRPLFRVDAEASLQAVTEKSAEVIKKLMSLGVMATINQPIDADTAQIVVEVHETPKIPEGFGKGKKKKKGSKSAENAGQVTSQELDAEYFAFQEEQQQALAEQVAEESAVAEEPGDFLRDALKKLTAGSKKTKEK